ncbi:MAG TPA: hypothetical protein VI248_12890 [Kineosporiaceae bacterium]
MDGPGTVDALPVDWSGHLPGDVPVPAARPASDDGTPDAPSTSTGRQQAPAGIAMARARLRAVTPLDVVGFVAACPSCGRDSEWTQERQDTRVRSTIRCACLP